MATHSGILAWEIPWTEGPGGLQSMGVTKESDTTEQLNSNKMFQNILSAIPKEEAIQVQKAQIPMNYYSNMEKNKF